MKGSSIPFKKNYILGISIILAAFVLGLMQIFTVKTLKSFDDTVTVRGLCEREVNADRVVYTISYTEKNNELAELRKTIAKNNDIVIAKLRKAGIDDSEINYSGASYSDEYNSWSDPDRIAYRYEATQTITVITSKMDLIKKLENTLETELVNEDIIASGYSDYQYLGLNEIKPEMIAESLDKARESAEEFAKNSHSKIGKMRTASQGYFEIEDLDENTPQKKKVRVVTTVTYYLK